MDCTKISDKIKREKKGDQWRKVHGQMDGVLSENDGYGNGAKCEKSFCVCVAYSVGCLISQCYGCNA